jgi:hypothetical protein
MDHENANCFMAFQTFADCIVKTIKRKVGTTAGLLCAVAKNPLKNIAKKGFGNALLLVI